MSTTPNDKDVWRVPRFVARRLLTAAEVGQIWAWGLKLHGLEQVWKQTRGLGVKVAVLDTGIDTNHPDFTNAIDDAKDFSGSVWGIEDRNGHGTHTAGTIGARDNGRGVVGVAPDCRLLVGKVLGDDGSGSFDAIAAAVDWAVAKGAKVISMSLGGPAGDPGLRDAIERAVAAGVFFVVAAGNSGPRPNTVEYPGKWEKIVLTVAAIDQHGQIADFSSRGPQVDVCAPGVKVLSCWPGGGYAELDGTSMATPFVAGTVALTIAARNKSGHPLRNQAELEAEIDRSAVPLDPSLNRDPNWGFGLVNPGNLLAFDPPPATKPPAVDLPSLEVVKVGPFRWADRDWTLTGVPVAPQGKSNSEA